MYIYIYIYIHIVIPEVFLDNYSDALFMLVISGNYAWELSPEILFGNCDCWLFLELCKDSISGNQYWKLLAALRVDHAGASLLL